MTTKSFFPAPLRAVLTASGFHSAIIVYFLVVNVFAFTVYGVDKRRAAAKKRRIPESTLLLLAALGGSPGALAAMYAFRHKTRRPKFTIGVPAILLAQAAAVCLLLGFFR